MHTRRLAFAMILAASVSGTPSVAGGQVPAGSERLPLVLKPAQTFEFRVNSTKDGATARALNRSKEASDVAGVPEVCTHRYAFEVKEIGADGVAVMNLAVTSPDQTVPVKEPAQYVVSKYLLRVGKRGEVQTLSGDGKAPAAAPAPGASDGCDASVASVLSAIFGEGLHEAVLEPGKSYTIEMLGAAVEPPAGGENKATPPVVDDGSALPPPPFKLSVRFEGSATEGNIKFALFSTAPLPGPKPSEAPHAVLSNPADGAAQTRYRFTDGVLQTMTLSRLRIEKPGDPPATEVFLSIVRIASDDGSHR